jgi:glycosyltransferase involved in cell wall biosynthesis
VIIPTYNRSKLLNYTSGSLLKQNIPTNTFEVIVSDDGSSDDTKEIAEQYKDLVNLRYVFQDDLGYCP